MSGIEETILDLVVEDDYGLWEVLWRLKSTEPGVSEARAIESATKAVLQMNRKGLVVLGRRSAGGSALIPDVEVPGVLSDPDSWREPQTMSEGVFVRATASGEDAYYS